MADTHSPQSETAKTSRSTPEDVEVRLSEIRGELRKVVGLLGEQSTEAMEDAKQAVANQKANLEQEIKKQPLRSVGIAAGIGFLVGMLLAR